MRKFQVTVNGNTYEVEVEEIGGSFQSSAPIATSAPVAPVAAPKVAAPVAPTTPAGANKVVAPDRKSVV